MLSNAEREQEQHFGSLRKTGVELRGDERKVVYAEISRDKS